MSEKRKTVTRKLTRAGGWHVAKRVAKTIPFGGTAVAVVLVGSDIRSKGLFRGLLNSGIDAIPFVGFTKNAIELFRGDFIPDRERPTGARSAGKNERVNGSGRMANGNNREGLDRAGRPGSNDGRSGRESS